MMVKGEFRPQKSASLERQLAAVFEGRFVPTLNLDHGESSNQNS